MPKKHGISHGLAAFIATIAAGMLIGILRLYIPFLMRIFDGVSLRLSKFILQKTDIEISSPVLTTAVFAAMLAFIWGVAFAYVHKD